MAEDIRENEMKSGIPALLRGIDADGSSVTATPDEVIAPLGLVSRNILFGVHDNGGYYLHIAQIDIDWAEGVANNLSLLVYGGNNYTLIPAVTIISMVYHRGYVSISKNCLTGGIEVGYSIENNIVKLFIRTENYNFPVSAIVLYKSENASIIENSSSYDMPAGYTTV